ncbi:TRAM domain-containing protein [Halopiger goleimassiliensis]|uniref:TRAM domain-containing protein n=1 Tax=Halopiger goleimassiliensis TaxID=1293048 RepID=UPI000677F595|nr:RNA-binding protein [Halopiger goleimassiliensis]
MVGTASLVIGIVVVFLLGSWVVRRFRGRSRERRRSRKRHEAAQQREPPVDLGDRRTVAVHDFSEHHTGERHAVCKVEGFVVFVEDAPADLEEGDVIDVEIRSFNRGHTSATAAYVGRN